MTIGEIEAFLAVVESGTISRAAEMLFISQPALSRRLKNLEGELGYELLVRRRGVRNVELSEAGMNFIELAKRWVLLWEDVQSLPLRKQYPVFRVSSLDSIGSYVFPSVYDEFVRMNDQVLLDIWDYNSYPAYEQMEAGLLDLAFIMDQRFSEKVTTMPAFSESMQLIGSQGCGFGRKVHALDLDPALEIHVSWSVEYEKWHSRWFSRPSRPYVVVAKMSDLEFFIQRFGSWAVVPASVASALKAKLSLESCELQEPPPRRITNYLTVPGNKSDYVDLFLELLRGHVSGLRVPGFEVLF